jgi:hypothetical protein
MTCTNRYNQRVRAHREHDQIDYWKPAAVGELLFNFWD